MDNQDHLIISNISFDLNFFPFDHTNIAFAVTRYFGTIIFVAFTPFHNYNQLLLIK